MGQAPAVMSILLVLSAMLSCFVAGWALTLRRSMPVMAFVLLNVAIACYTGGYAVEVNQSTVAGALAGVKLEYVGLAWIPVLLFVVAAQLVLGRPLTDRWLLLLGIIPVVTLALVLTMPAHDLFYTDPRMSTTGPFPALQFERGPWYLVNYTYQTVLAVTATVLLIRYSLRVRAVSGWAAFLVTGAALLPLAGSLAYFLGLVPDGIDPVPLLMGFTGAVMAAALFGLRLFDLVPAAREVALDSASEALLVIDSLGLVRDFNPAAKQLPGLAKLSIGSALPKGTVVGRQLQDLVARPGSTMEFSTAGPLGEQHFRATSYRVSHQRGSLSGTALMVRDISTDRLLWDELARQATTDELTGALARRALMQEGSALVSRASATGDRLAVLMLDLDGFKDLNDDHGHAAGDRALVVAGEVMRTSVRSQDLLGRLGGDEFVIIMPGADLPTAELVAERLQTRFRGISPPTLPRPLRASIGVVAHRPTAADTLPDYLAAADQALYRAKRSGGDRMVIAD